MTRTGFAKLSRAAIAAALLTLAFTAQAGAVNLKSGDIVVSDKRFPTAAPDGPGALFSYNPGSGAETLISQAGSFAEPEDVAIGADGTLFVADKGENGQGPGSNTPGLNGLLIAVNPKTGAQTVISTGVNLVNPTALAIAPNGLIFIADRGATSGAGLIADGRVIRVDPVTKTQALVASAGQLQEPRGISISPKDGSIIVSDAADDQLVKVNPVGGAQTPIHTGAPLNNPQHSTPFPNGSLALADSGPAATGSIFRVDTATGTPQLLTNNATLSGVGGIARELNGSFVTTARGTAIARTTPAGATTLFVASPQLKEATGIAVAQICGGRFANEAFIGTPGKDTMKGTPVGDVFVGGDGKDTIKGLAGKDRICGGKGKDKLVGGKGNDTLVGGKGQDQLVGGPGNNKAKQ
jgi:sugar lactone lactonase YvrE